MCFTDSPQRTLYKKDNQTHTHTPANQRQAKTAQQQHRKLNKTDYSQTAQREVKLGIFFSDCLSFFALFVLDVCEVSVQGLGILQSAYLFFKQQMLHHDTLGPATHHTAKCYAQRCRRISVDGRLELDVRVESDADGACWAHLRAADSFSSAELDHSSCDCFDMTW